MAPHKGCEHMPKSNLMAITDRSHIHKYIPMAIIDHLAAHGHMRSLTAISERPTSQKASPIKAPYRLPRSARCRSSGGRSGSSRGNSRGSSGCRCGLFRARRNNNRSPRHQHLFQRGLVEALVAISAMARTPTFRSKRSAATCAIAPARNFSGMLVRHSYGISA